MGDGDTTSDVRMNDDETIEIIGGNGVYLLGPIALPVPPPPPPTPYDGYTMGGSHPAASGSVTASMADAGTAAIGGAGSGVVRELEVYERLKTINDDESGLLNLGEYLELLRRAVLNLDARLKAHHM